MYTHYDFMELTPVATMRQIELRLRELADLYGNSEDHASQRQFELIKQAYETLSDYELRKAYDLELARAAWVADCELKWESGNKAKSATETFSIDWDAFPSTLTTPVVDDIDRALVSRKHAEPDGLGAGHTERFNLAA